eukprot:s2341_g2.t1
MCRCRFKFRAPMETNVLEWMYKSCGAEEATAAASPGMSRLCAWFFAAQPPPRLLLAAPNNYIWPWVRARTLSP